MALQNEPALWEVQAHFLSALVKACGACHAYRLTAAVGLAVNSPRKTSSFLEL